MKVLKVIIEYEDGYSVIEDNVDELMIQFYELLAIGKECDFEFDDVDMIWYPKQRKEYIQ